MVTICCPHCRDTERQVKKGRHRSGSRRCLCKACGRGYTPKPARNGYPEELRARAVTLHLSGFNLRRAARAQAVSHQSVANWAKALFPCLGDRGTAALMLDANPALSLDELRASIGRPSD